MKESLGHRIMFQSSKPSEQTLKSERFLGKRKKKKKEKRVVEIRTRPLSVRPGTPSATPINLRLASGSPPSLTATTAGRLLPSDQGSEEATHFSFYQ